MRKHCTIISLTLLVMTAAMLLLNGCNTWHGAGKDVEHAGQEMQEK
jgi:predicted small secreted protein